jgi:hypothetical protein
MEVTAAVWPLSFLSNAPDFAHHKITRWSAAAASRRPSGEKSTVRTLVEQAVSKNLTFSAALLHIDTHEPTAVANILPSGENRTAEHGAGPFKTALRWNNA